MKNFVKKFEEAKLKDKDMFNSHYESSFFPLSTEIIYEKTGGVIFYPSDYKALMYAGNLSEQEFLEYRKELSNLFKDLDYIMSKINKKYGLKLKK